MILRFDAALTRQDIFANGNELASVMGMDTDAQGRRVYEHPRSRELQVATIEHPVLVTDAFRIAELGDEDPVQRDTVFALYGSPHRTTVYDTTALEFEQGRFPGVWGPSVDTLLFCRALATLDLPAGSDVVEIGSGSGFISKYILEHFDSVSTATMVDMNPLAIASSRESITDPRARFHSGDGLEFLRGHKADLVVCNPPYIPRRGSIDDNPYEGVQLLVQLIERCAEYLEPGGRLILNLSSLCLGIGEAAIARAGVEARVIDSLEVPLKVFNVLNNPEWRRYLVEHHGLTSRLERGYEHWHTLSMFAISPG